MSELRGLLKKLVAQETPLQTLPCIVTDVDKEKRVCTCEPVDGRPAMHDVRLMASGEPDEYGMVLIPAKNSEVLVCLIGNNENAGFVALCTEVEEVVLKLKGGFKQEISGDSMILNGGSNGGLILVQELVKEINALKQQIATHQHLYLPTGSPTPVPTTPDPATNAPMPPIVAAKLENPKIKH